MVYEPSKKADAVESHAHGHAADDFVATQDTAAHNTAAMPAGIFDKLREKPKGPTTPPPGTHAFGSDEHQQYGNEGAAQAGYKGTFQPVAGSSYPFELTQGDISMLSGDYFDPRDKDERGKSIDDNLWKIAASPSKKPGQTLGSQDEIVYAIHHARSGDPRFQPGGVWSKLKLDDPRLLAAVNERYLRRAAVNFEHFVDPKGPGSGGPKSKDRTSAGGSYRALHESALLMAHDAKKAGKPVNEAMAHEAAASHYLQDGFSAGHLRVPRASISEYWNAKYPLFFEQFKKTIAQDVAIYKNAHQTNPATIGGSVLDIMTEVRAGIDAATANLPPMGFDTLPGIVTHDVDNEEGLFVTNDLGEQWKTFGDGHGGVRKDAKERHIPTRTHISKAVRLGVEDVQHAYAADTSLPDSELLAHVRASTPAPAKPDAKYGPEQAMPRLDPAHAQGALNWKVADFATLWNTKVRSDRPDTYGDRIKSSMNDGEFHNQLTGLASQFQPVRTHASTLHPEVGYREGFMNPMFKAPQQGIQKILDYNPGRGQISGRADGATMEDMERLDKIGAKQAGKEPGHIENSAIKGLTFTQRVQYVKNLRGGFSQRDEAYAIYSLFYTAKDGERVKLYEAVEGKWTGRVAGALFRALQADPDLVQEVNNLLNYAP